MREAWPAMGMDVRAPAGMDTTACCGPPRRTQTLTHSRAIRFWNDRRADATEVRRGTGAADSAAASRWRTRSQAPGGSGEAALERPPPARAACRPVSKPPACSSPTGRADAPRGATASPSTRQRLPRAHGACQTFPPLRIGEGKKGSLRCTGFTPSCIYVKWKTFE